MYEKFNEAVLFAARAHAHQLRKITETPYIYHPMHVANEMDTEIRTCIALLHDVIEDTCVDEEMLRLKGIPEEVIEGVKVLTRNKGESYRQYIEDLIASGNVDAMRVKLADLHHNLDASRMPEGKQNRRLRDRYLEAEALIKQRLQEAD